MPTTSPSGWKKSFSDDFNHSSFADDSAWWAFSGKPAGASVSVWSPFHDVESNGLLRLDASKSRGPIDNRPAGTWVTGGVRDTLAQTYGKWLVRFRIDKGVGISVAAMLWPASNAWPPEIDFVEDNGKATHPFDMATMHYGAHNAAISKSVEVDMTDWHTLGVEWTPGKLVYTLDGQAWASVVSADVPAVPMVLVLQTAAYGCYGGWRSYCPDAQTPSEVDMDIDWVVAYTPASS